MAHPITKELLEELTGCEVLNYLVDAGQNPGDGYLSTMFSVKVELQNNTKEGKEQPKETRQILFKCLPPDPARQSYLRTTNMFYSEFAFYKVWLQVLHDFQVDIGLHEDKMLTISVPPFVGGHAIDYSKWEEKADQTNSVIPPLENFVAMADLRSEGYRMVNKEAGLDLDHLTLAFTELAKIHALSWAYKNRMECDIIEKYPCMRGQWDKIEIHDVWMTVVGSSIDTAAKTLDVILGEGNHLSKSAKSFEGILRKVIQFFLEQNESVEKEAWKMHRSPPQEMVKASENEELWRLQLHGDTRGNNMLFKYNAAGKPERVMLVDLQQTRQGCPTADLTNLIYSVTTAKFRNAHMDSLLQLYCDKFTEYCDLFKVPYLPDFSFTSLKRRFHRAKLSGCMLGLLLFPMLFLETDKEVDMEQVGKDTSMEEMMTDSYVKNALESSLYKERILELVQDLYDEGVI